VKKTLLTCLLLGVVILAAAAACTEAQREALNTFVAAANNPTPVPAASFPPIATPAFSLLSTPTQSAVASGPMGTLTAIAYLFASPTPNAEPYTIVNRGVPHFIEFHAWW
jgi:hypothetical protein